MDDKRRVRCSKFLSKHLRHEPERIGLQLDEGGWTDVDALLTACARAHMAMTRAELDEVVERNEKQRFSFDTTGTRIRANQGHSIEVDLGLQPIEPPAVLFHGTAHVNLENIQQQGLRPMARHHVHLSADRETALKVGARHGKPVLLYVDAGAMCAQGHQFFRSENGVWLCDEVPAEFLSGWDAL